MPSRVTGRTPTKCGWAIGAATQSGTTTGTTMTATTTRAATIDATEAMNPATGGITTDTMTGMTLEQAAMGNMGTRPGITIAEVNAVTGTMGTQDTVAAESVQGRAV